MEQKDDYQEPVSIYCDLVPSESETDDDDDEEDDEEDVAPADKKKKKTILLIMARLVSL